jgi:hypothetical protein
MADFCKKVLDKWENIVIMQAQARSLYEAVGWLTNGKETYPVHPGLLFIPRKIGFGGAVSSLEGRILTEERTCSSHPH